jgi:hypothetical protein
LGDLRNKINLVTRAKQCTIALQLLIDERRLFETS